MVKIFSILTLVCGAMLLTGCKTCKTCRGGTVDPYYSETGEMRNDPAAPYNRVVPPDRVAPEDCHCH